MEADAVDNAIMLDNTELRGRPIKVCHGGHGAEGVPGDGPCMSVEGGVGVQSLSTGQDQYDCECVTCSSSQLCQLCTQQQCTQQQCYSRWWTDVVVADGEYHS